MFTFWSIVWAFVILSFLNGLIQWDIPKELQIPDFLLQTIGGLPSFYGYKLELDGDDEGLDEWLQNFVEEEIEKLPSIEFKSSQSQIPRCSLIKSSRTNCLTEIPQNCNRNDERCAQFWLRKPGPRSIQCLSENGQQLNCNLNGYIIQKIYHNKEQMTLIMSNLTTNSLVNQQIESFQGCETYFVKESNRTLISVPIPEMKERVPTQELTLRQNTQTTIFYKLDDYNKNLTLLWTLFEAHLKTSKLCTCKTCYEIKNDIQAEMAFNGNILGLTFRLLTESNTTFVNLTANWKNDDEENVGQLRFKMKEEMIDRKTPLFWRRPGRFDCPSEITCPLELFYIFQVQYGLILSDYILEILFIFAIIMYQKNRSKKYF